MSAADCIEILNSSIDEERAHRDAYGPPSEAATLEVARAADAVVMSELLVAGPIGETARLERTIREWGINDALARAIPREKANTTFRPFPSLPENQVLADDFLISCGSIRLAERMLGWMHESLIAAEYREHGIGGDRVRVMVLRAADSSLGDEEIGRAGLRWESDSRMRQARRRERELMKRYRPIRPDLEEMCSLVHGAFPVYDRAYDLLDYFEECADFYLERIFGTDLLGPDDVVGGLPFRLYLAAVRVLSGLQHLHLAVLDILRLRHPGLDLRNLMAWPSSVEITIGIVSRRLGCSFDEAERLLAPLTLTSENAAAHVASGEPAWPGLIRASERAYIHPLFGLDVNPYLFLLTNLRETHRGDWDRSANLREARWQREFETMLSGGRYDQFRARGLLLKREGRHLTDVDFSAYDRDSGDLLLIQLKWQHPIGADDRARRSMARNLVVTSNDWIEAVSSWLQENGAEEMVRRLGFTPGAKPKPRLFVIARYNAQFSGRTDRDRRAEWVSWAHFKKAWQHVGGRPARDLSAFIRKDIAEAKRRHTRVGLTFRVGNLGVLLNPRRVPA